jgi:hypothetical protein
MATPSYRERMKAQRAETRAKRDAEKAEWHRRAELRYEIRKLAMDAVKAGIRHPRPARYAIECDDRSVGLWLRRSGRSLNEILKL